MAGAKKMRSADKQRQTHIHHMAPPQSIKLEYAISFPNSQNFHVACVKRTEDVAKGLGGHHLSSDNGMLFMFQREDERHFWMKGCVVGLDMLFLDKNLQVKNIASLQSVPLGTPDHLLPSHHCREPCMVVLELLKGTCERNNIRVGDFMQASKLRQPYTTYGGGSDKTHAYFQ